MIYIESGSTNPYYNLALEEFVFENLDRGKEYFMLWQNENSIIVGKYQNTAEEINRAAVDAQGIRVARRLSGGGAVYHDMGNLNFTFVVDKQNVDGLNFRVFVEPVVETLKSFGVEAEFSGRNDILVNGMKISGNSQYVKKDRVMHHGCIMLDSNLDKVQDALRVSKAKIESKSIKSVRSRVTTINEHAPNPIPMELFKQTLKRQVMSGKDEGSYELTDADRSVVNALIKEKYGTWDWNYGASPACRIRRELKYDGGLICAQMEVEHGSVTEVHLSGDFFGNRDLNELEHKLTGLVLDEHLADRLSDIPVGEYIHGMTADMLAGLLRG